MDDARGQLITFHLGKERYGINLNYVQEIIRPPVILKVPMTPEYFLGLANLRGEILPILDGRRKLQLPPNELSDSSRVVVLKLAQEKIGLLVDRMAEVVDLEGAVFEEIANAQVNTRLVSRVVRLPHTEELIMEIKPEGIFEKKLDQVSRGQKSFELTEVNESQEIAQENSSLEQLIGFKLGNEEFSLPIAAVQEIVRVPEIISKTPGLPAYVEGIITLRNNTLPIINLRLFLGLERKEYDEKTRIIVLNLSKEEGSYLFGLVTDEVTEVLRVQKSDIDDVPSYLANDAGELINGVCKLNSGQRLIYTLVPEKLLAESKLQLEAKNEAEQREVISELMSQENQFVIFGLDTGEYGVEIGNVQEIIHVPEITSIPQAPYFVEGIINLRGAILPVLNLRKKFNLQLNSEREAERIIVVDYQGLKLGLMVDTVREVLKINEKEIEKTPALLNDEIRQEFISGIAKINGGERLILLLDLKHVISREEKEQIEEALDIVQN
ncbi:chemotaxis protein CheW [Carboxydothermus hydrogenoformans]|uniref:Chemotaxis protein CheW n=1 Tax=Carboxydothermus hydrogenoformans (strain ATCC BAA-161 / DSM 6008 / Z-2901) TaxID=246194 RepID=Q3ADA7_CARHZ|nr:chemotaxis protein CheW [Carboxydothermus hydrogenoformans]ABB15203.1 chemotaxis protein CheW [Carboxydothermus hydrogenoformans Z-2901]